MIAVERDLSGWGRYPHARCRTVAPARIDALGAVEPGTVARGNGRSYGDASLGAKLTLELGGCDRLLAFDEATGLLTCEGGTLLSDIIDALLPRGWFPTVTPGTRFVTVGGAIAADVHGKNHHGAGSFGDHLEWLDLALGDGEVLHCSRLEHPELFWATCGGMGLTGTILRACFRLRPVGSALLTQSLHRTRGLAETMALMEAELDRTYSVAWIDCLAHGASLGRSVVSLADHAGGDRPAPGAALARPARTARRVPIDLPPAALNRLSVRAFNALYYRGQRTGTSLVDLDPFFYPLDALADWNRIYGRRGFVQYQCVLPLESSEAGLTALLSAVAARGSASFLAVLKRMGPSSSGLLSFPMPGYTLALDFPATTASLALLDELDAITLAHGGRLYLAKDARMAPATLAAGYPGLAAFRDVRARYGLTERWQSLLSRRLEI